MADAITKSNLLSESWQNVYDLINSKSNVVDPTTVSTEARKWVYSREPDVKSHDFKGFPYIIIYPSSASFSEEQTVNGQKKDIIWVVEVEVVTSDRGWNNRDGKGATDNDAISDDILETFNDDTNRDTLLGNGMYFSRPDVTSVVVEPFNNTLIYRRSFLLNFKVKMSVF